MSMLPPQSQLSLPPRVAGDPAAFRKEKAHLRQQFFRRRQVIPADLSDTTTWKVINNLRTLLGGMAPGVVALYHARGGELSLHGLAEELWREGQTVCLPRVAYRGHPLTFNIWLPGMALEPDALGIPAATGAEIVPTVLILPMLGYSRQGYRLGSGGGYYDLTVPALPRPVHTIGVCHTELEVAAFPAEPHDLRLHHIVTGKEVIHCL